MQMRPYLQVPEIKLFITGGTIPSTDHLAELHFLDGRGAAAAPSF